MPLRLNGPRRWLPLADPDADGEILQIVEQGLKDGRRVTFRPPTLEDAFIRMVGGSIDEENA